MTIFKQLGIFTKPEAPAVNGAFEGLQNFLSTRVECLYTDNDKIAEWISSVDLLLVMGGDGSLLRGARYALPHQVPVLGINLGKLGFLTDIQPQHIQTQLTAILEGHYKKETRHCLALEWPLDDSGSLAKRWIPALNDIVLQSTVLNQMLEFQVFINDSFAFSQKADGLILATTTGSTAYALSAGGPIVYPSVPAVVLVPMFAHALTSRPIVIPAGCVVEIALSDQLSGGAKISLDGDLQFSLPEFARFKISAYPDGWDLLHPVEYDYFAILREKLGWAVNVHSDSDHCLVPA